MRLAIAAAAVLASLVLLAPSAEGKSPPMTIAGPDLPYTITAPWPDQQAFWLAKQPPTVPRRPPPTLGPGYEVVSWYWNRAIGSGNSHLQANDVALYYPDCAWSGRVCDRGVVRVTKAGEGHWLVLDQERDMILRMYVVLGRAGMLSPEPTILEVLAARMAHSNGGEHIAAEVDGRPIDQTGKNLVVFWQEARTLERELIRPFPLRPGVLNVKFTLPEGRELWLRYLPWSGHFIDPSDGGDTSSPEVQVRGLKASAALRHVMADVLLEPLPAADLPAAGAGPSGAPPLVPEWALAAAAALAAAGVGAGATAGAALLRRR